MMILFACCKALQAKREAQIHRSPPFLGRKMSQILTRVCLVILVAIFCLVTPCRAFSPFARDKAQGVVSTRRYRREGATGCSPTPNTATSLHASSSPQVLEFQEPTTGVTVKLVGCMHYNPASIQLTEDTINELALDNKLGSVVIESCDIRWNQTKSLPPKIQQLLQSEMKAACELATETYQRPVVLGDQRINITVSSLKQGLQETIVDLVTPWNGGWGRLLGNVTSARKEALPFGEPYLNALAFLDPKLILAAPVSLVKYPLSYFFKAPLRTTVALTLLFLLDQEADATMVTLDQMTFGDWAGSLSVSVAEIALFGRVFLKELLAERNTLLARNILEQCKLYQASTTSSETSPPLFWNFWDQSPNRPEKNIDMTTQEIYYVEGPTNAATGSSRDFGDQQQDKAVVAVLGMAHCNGIMKLLKEQKV